MNFKRGFLPSRDPLCELPDDFSVLETMAALLPKLLVSDQLRKKLEKLPQLPLQQLKTELQLERAMLLLSFLAHAYVWGEKSPAKKIPKQLAIPWYEVACKLSRPPVLSYASYALHNWRRIDKSKPIALGNITLLQNFHGGIDEEWFVLVHVDIEAKAVPAISAIIQAQQAVAAQNDELLAQALQKISLAIDAICKTLKRMLEHCDPYIYYNRVRPYIHGWKDNPVLPKGIIYEGVDAYGSKPQKFRGETGAQSSIIPALDSALGIKHKKDMLSIYLQEMLEYMPKKHREFLQSLAHNSQIRHYVQKNYHRTPVLRKSYNDCIRRIGQFRTIHIGYAARYIQKQSQTSLANPTATGTGGTPFMDYLRKHKDECLKHVI